MAGSGLEELGPTDPGDINTPPDSELGFFLQNFPSLSVATQIRDTLRELKLCEWKAVLEELKKNNYVPSVPENYQKYKTFEKTIKQLINPFKYDVPPNPARELFRGPFTGFLSSASNIDVLVKDKEHQTALKDSVQENLKYVNDLLLGEQYLTKHIPLIDAAASIGVRTTPQSLSTNAPQTPPPKLIHDIPSCHDIPPDKTVLAMITSQKPVTFVAQSIYQLRGIDSAILCPRRAMVVQDPDGNINILNPRTGSVGLPVNTAECMPDPKNPELINFVTTPAHTLQPGKNPPTERLSFESQTLRQEVKAANGDATAIKTAIHKYYHHFVYICSNDLHTFIKRIAKATKDPPILIFEMLQVGQCKSMAMLTNYLLQDLIPSGYAKGYVALQTGRTISYDKVYEVRAEEKHAKFVFQSTSDQLLSEVETTASVKASFENLRFNNPHLQTLDEIVKQIEENPLKKIELMLDFKEQLHTLLKDPGYVQYKTAPIGNLQDELTPELIYEFKDPLSKNIDPVVLQKLKNFQLYAQNGPEVKPGEDLDTLALNRIAISEYCSAITSFHKDIRKVFYRIYEISVGTKLDNECFKLKLSSDGLLKAMLCNGTSNQIVRNLVDISENGRYPDHRLLVLCTELNDLIYTFLSRIAFQAEELRSKDNLNLNTFLELILKEYEHFLGQMSFGNLPTHIEKVLKQYEHNTGGLSFVNLLKNIKGRQGDYFEQTPARSQKIANDAHDYLNILKGLRPPPKQNRAHPLTDVNRILRQSRHKTEKDPYEIEGYTELHPGDDARRIDEKASARTDKFVTKVNAPATKNQEMPKENIEIVLDLNPTSIPIYSEMSGKREPVDTLALVLLKTAESNICISRIHLKYYGQTIPVPNDTLQSLLKRFNQAKTEGERLALLEALLTSIRHIGLQKFRLHNLNNPGEEGDFAKTIGKAFMKLNEVIPSLKKVRQIPIYNIPDAFLKRLGLNLQISLHMLRWYQNHQRDIWGLIRYHGKALDEFVKYLYPELHKKYHDLSYQCSLLTEKDNLGPVAALVARTNGFRFTPEDIQKVLPELFATLSQNDLAKNSLKPFIETLCQEIEKELAQVIKPHQGL